MAAAVVVGVLIGLILGTLGGGGAIVTIPVLAYGFGMSAHQSTTASLIIVGVASITAMIAHARAGRVDWARGCVLAAFGMGGAVLGSWVATGLDAELLLGAFGLLLALVAVLMFRRARAAQPQQPPESLRQPRVLALTVVAGFGVGLLTGFFGVGGGFAIVPALTVVLGLGMPAAVATSLLVIAINSAAALVTKLSLGVSLDWPLVIAFTVATMAGSLGGAHLAGRVRPEVLKRAFAGLLLLVAGYTLVTSGIHLLND